MKYFIIAGEKSGDLHGSNLIRGLIKSDPDAEILCWGGELMAEAGGKVLKHYSQLAFMGFLNVLLNLRAIIRNMDMSRKQIAGFKPDAVILIDFPGFNLRVAKFAKLSGFRVFYYISPKLWAWKESRVEKVKKYVDRMFIIFPFEVEFYKKHGIEVQYFGNPLVDQIENWKSSSQGKAELRRSLGIGEKPVIVLLAGSRKHEVKHILPQMITASLKFPQYEFILAGVGTIPNSLYESIIGTKGIRVICDRTYELFSVAEAGLVKSGTSTLEAALLDVPQVVCYSADLFSMLIAWFLVKIKYISLVNLITGRESVKELVQFENNPRRIAEELRKIIIGGSGRERMLSEYVHLKNILGPAGASERVAAEISESLRKKE
jgi:lipid-A-disaccharide synthase